MSHLGLIKVEAAMKNAWRYLVSFAAMLACTAASAGTVVYYHNDIAGTPVAATDTSGQVLWRESYRPYGERLTNSAASAGNDVWFTSRRQDVETGLVYMGARYYHPVVGRFISTDPVGFDEKNVHSFSRYAYANSNPARFVDRNGMWAEDLFVGAISLGMSISAFKNEPNIANGLVLAADIVLVAIPGVPAFAGLTVHGGEAAASLAGKGAKSLADDALVCRGGTCTAEKFSSGRGVTVDASGNLNGVSVNSAAGKSLEELSVGIPNRQVGVTTVGDIRRAGGDVMPSPSSANPNHCTLCGISPKEAERLFTPTVPNPGVR